MKITKTIIILLFLCLYSNAQNHYKAILKDKETNEILPGVNAIVKGTSIGAVSDNNGLITINNIPDGLQSISISMLAYEILEISVNFPVKSDSLSVIFLEPETEELEEVNVTTTRSSRVITDIPTRIETIASGELAEKAGMQSANIKMILTESTGIQTQQTSAISANTNIRIQGLDGKYTQLLKDGFPLYSGFSGGLSIMQIPPLDLKRAEVIKGSSSTLYGGGAIAGLINLITKEPTDKDELTFMANATSASGLDLNSFYAHKFNKLGITVFTSRNSQQAYDPDKDGFSDIPQNTLFNFNPKLYYYINSSTSLVVGLNTSFEDRLGGDMVVINHKSNIDHSFYQQNTSGRYSTQLKFEKKFSNNTVLTAKNSIAYFSRNIEMPAYLFEGQQIASFSEITYLIPADKSEWITGINEWTDNFWEKNPANALTRNYKQFTTGLFTQNNYKVNENFIVESGLRIDYLKMTSPFFNAQSYWFLLPRLSFMYKFSNNFTSRVGGGLGYKAPGIFAEESESQGFRNVMPINLNLVKPEHSIGFNFDLNYKTLLFSELAVNINQMFFYTRLMNPVVVNAIKFSQDTIDYQSADGSISSRGCETNVKFRYENFSIYLGYTFIDAERDYDGIKIQNPLTARHRLYFTPMYEIENKIRIGYEVFYISPQILSSGEKVRDYWLMGISAEKTYKNFSLFVNFENMLDSRQSRWQAMYSGSIQKPKFNEIWAPTDGFIYNAGFRLFFN